MAKAQRVLVVGWDSAPPKELFEVWRKDMPNLDRLINEGIHGPLRSTDPPITVPAWCSMMSSRNPGQLGFYGFRNRRVGEYTGKWIANAQAVRVDRVWDILSRYGKRSCVFNVPQTYPVRAINGVMISSFLTPSTESDYTYPKSLKADVERVSGGYVIDVDEFRTDDKAWLLDQINQMTEKRFRVAQFLMQEKGPWDFFMMVYMGPDRLQHGFWKYIDKTHAKYEPGNPFENAARDYYVLLDQQLGELIEMAGPDTRVLVVSDHGAKRMDGSFHVNDWLIQEGLLTLKEPLTGVTRFKEENVDWSKTVAWAWGGYYARIFMNVQGREPEGVVPADRYEAVRDDLVRRLEATTDHTGRVMKTRALKPQDIFTGPCNDAPDLFVYFDDLYWRAGQDVGHDSLHSFDTEIGPDDSVHDYDGILVMSPAGNAGGRVEGAQVMDIAPTILDTLGVPVPREMEGKVIAAD